MQPMDPLEQFATNLRRRRSSASLTQEELGFKADLHPTEVSRLERGKRDPRLSTIVRLARALDITTGELLRGVR